MIYLDNAATSFPKPEVVYNSIIDAMKNYGANPGRSGHKLALKASRSILETRENLAEFFNIDNPMNIIFTFNATDGLNLAIKGILKPGDHVITTMMEHNSVLRPLMALKEKGVEVTLIQCNHEGFVNVDDIEKNIKQNTKLIITTHASNVTGTIMPIVEIGKLAKEKNILYMVDAAQTAGAYPIDVEKINIDILVFPGHKCLLGPQGTGGVYIREGIGIDELRQGGTGSKSFEFVQPQIVPDKYESGTPNAPGIIGLGAGVKFILDKGINTIREHEKYITKFFIEELRKIDKVKIYGPCDIDKRMAVVPINIGDMDSSEVSFLLDSEYDIGTRPGLHCAPLAHKTIGTFEQGVVRFSFGYFTKIEEIKVALKAIKEISEFKN